MLWYAVLPPASQDVKHCRRRSGPRAYGGQIQRVMPCQFAVASRISPLSRVPLQQVHRPDMEVETYNPAPVWLQGRDIGDMSRGPEI